MLLSVFQLILYLHTPYLFFANTCSLLLSESVATLDYVFSVSVFQCLAAFKLLI